MTRKYKVLSKIIHVILFVVFISILSSCKDDDNIVNVEEDNTVYVELTALADGFGNKDSIAQDEEISSIVDFFSTNDELWGFMPLGISFFDSAITSISSVALKNSLNNPKSHFWGPYTTDDVHQNWNYLSSITRHSVYLIFAIRYNNEKYFVYESYKAIPRNGPWIELEIDYSNNSGI